MPEEGFTREVRVGPYIKAEESQPVWMELTRQPVLRLAPVLNLEAT